MPALDDTPEAPPGGSEPLPYATQASPTNASHSTADRPPPAAETARPTTDLPTARNRSTAPPPDDIKAHSDKDELRSAAQESFDQGRYPEVLHLLAESEDRASLKLRARSLYELGQSEDAQSLLADLQQQNPTDPWPHVLWGVIELTDGRPREAVASLDQAVELTRSEDPHALFYRGVARFRTGRLADAEQDFRTARRLVGADSELGSKVARFLELVAERERTGESDVRPRSGVVVEAVRGGEDINLSDLRGRTILLHLWASWCAPCVKELPALVRFYERNNEALRDRGVELLIVSTDRNRSELVAFVARHLRDLPRDFRLYWDSEATLSEIYGWGLALPETVLVDPHGHIENHRGSLAWDDLDVEELLRELGHDE